jgi:iron complex transport system ATP-binding protein
LSSDKGRRRTSVEIQLRDVVVERDGVAILRNVSWTAHTGEHWVILGPNGAGKSTLLNVLTGYEWPTSGTVETMGARYGEVDLREHRRQIALVSDSLGKMLDGELTTAEVIMAGARGNLRVFDEPTAAEIRRFRKVTALASVTGLLERAYRKLSTGERQRTLFARSLMSRPRVVVLDEPCQGLDFPGRELLLDAMTRFLSEKNPPSLILSTHHLEEIPAGITHAMLMAGGEIVAAGPVDKVMTSTRLSRLIGISVKVSKSKGRYTARVVREL